MAILMYGLLGCITGISGIFFQGISHLNQSDNLWRVLFLVGLILGPLIAHTLFDLAIPAPSEKGAILAIIAGLIGKRHLRRIV